MHLFKHLSTMKLAEGCSATVLDEVLLDMYLDEELSDVKLDEGDSAVMPDEVLPGLSRLLTRARSTEGRPSRVSWWAAERAASSAYSRRFRVHGWRLAHRFFLVAHGSRARAAT